MCQSEGGGHKRQWPGVGHQDKAQSLGAVVHIGRNRKGLTGCASLKARDASGQLNRRPGNSIIGSQGLGETEPEASWAQLRSWKLS